MADGLTPKQRRFVAEYLVDSNATQAAIRAGYSAKTAGPGAAQLLKNIKVKSALAERTEKVLAKAGLSAERWAEEMACRTHFDPAELYRPDGSLIPINELPEHVRRAVSLEIPLPDGTKMKTPNKDAALADVGKHLGVFERDNAQKTPNIRIAFVAAG